MREIVAILRRTYCQTIGIEFMHISNAAQKAWIQERIEGRDKEIAFTREGKRAILNKLVEAEGFEKFIDVKYTGTKRFGLDGGESMIPALEQIIKRGGALGVREIVIGMPQRGRLNVLAQVMAKPHRAIFHEFKGGSSSPDDVEGSGDVKYHKGFSADLRTAAGNVHVVLAFNPSHLEVVDAVVERLLGRIRKPHAQSLFGQLLVPEIIRNAQNARHETTAHFSVNSSLLLSWQRLLCNVEVPISVCSCHLPTKLDIEPMLAGQ